MKNRLRKIIPYLFVLIMLVGFLGVTNPTHAAAPFGTCTSNGTATGFWVPETLCPSPAIWKEDTASNQIGTCLGTNNPNANATTVQACSNMGGTMWKVGATANPVTPGTVPPPTTPPQEDALEKAIEKLDCGVIGDASITQCIVKGSYLVFFQLPAFILTVSGNFFNAFAGLTLSSKLYTSNNFIPEAWAVVRDISNIFFIIILLYTAIQTILGLSHDAKKTIAQVIIMAFLINFSMFFTRIIIDSSNVLALIFYNKIAVKGPDNATIPYEMNTANTGVIEKDMGGALVSGFNPARLMDAKILEKHTITLPNGDKKEVERPEESFFLALIFVSCAIFLFAAYAFFVAGFSLLGRLVELWMLIIFSPFAFMTSALPLGEIMEDMNWKKWMHRLMSTAFMAPVFMFFMYLIARIVSADMFSQFLTKNTGTGTTSATSKILAVAIPATIIILLLLKATSYAKKGGGQLGTMAMGLGKMVGGLALGAATGGAALAATATLGKGSSYLLGKKGEDWRAKSEEKGLGGWAAKMALKTTNLGANASFDARKAPGAVKDLFKNLTSAEGGYKGRVKKSQEKDEEGRKLFKTTMSDDEVKAWSIKNGHVNEDGSAKYQSADQLNEHRMQTYKNNLGKTGFISSMAYSGAKAKLGIDASEEEIDKLAKKIKLGVGIALGGIATLTTGGAALSAIGAAGSAGATLAGGAYSTLGATIGGGAALGAVAGIPGAAATKIFSSADGHKAAAKTIDKEIKQMRNVSSRLEENTRALKNLEELLKKGDQLIKDDKGEHIKLMKSDGTVDLTKVEEQLANLAFIAKREELKLQKLVQQGAKDEEIKPVMAAWTENSIKIEQLKRLQTSGSEKSRLNKQIYEAGRDKERIENTGPSAKPSKEKQPHKSGPAHPPTPPAASSGGSIGGGGTPAHP